MSSPFSSSSDSLSEELPFPIVRPEDLESHNPSPIPVQSYSPITNIFGENIICPPPSQFQRPFPYEPYSPIPKEPEKELELEKEPEKESEEESEEQEEEIEEEPEETEKKIEEEIKENVEKNKNFFDSLDEKLKKINEEGSEEVNENNDDDSEDDDEEEVEDEEVEFEEAEEEEHNLEYDDEDEDNEEDEKERAERKKKKYYEIIKKKIEIDFNLKKRVLFPLREFYEKKKVNLKIKKFELEENEEEVEKQIKKINKAQFEFNYIKKWGTREQIAQKWAERENLICFLNKLNNIIKKLREEIKEDEEEVEKEKEKYETKKRELYDYLNVQKKEFKEEKDGKWPGEPRFNIFKYNLNK